jgi:hypothetical protein
MYADATLIRRFRAPVALFAAGLCALGLMEAGSAGIQGSGFQRMSIVGPVDDTDGFKVNDVAYDASQARVVINGNAASSSGLHKGHVVTVRVKEGGGNQPDTVEEVVLVSDVRGEIASVDASASTVSVLGQTVLVTPEAVLDPAIASQGFAGLQPGLWISVSGYPNAQGTLVASRIDLDTMPETQQVRGRVAALDTQLRSFLINGATVDYSVAGVVGVIANGTTVTVRGPILTSTSSLVASHVEVFAGAGEEGDKGNIRGLITAFTSESDFDVNGQRVLANSGTKFILHGAALGTNVSVWVNGRFDAAGALVADKIQVK